MEKIKEGLKWMVVGFFLILLLVNFAITVVVACGFYIWDKVRGKL